MFHFKKRLTFYKAHLIPATLRLYFSSEEKNNTHLRKNLSFPSDTSTYKTSQYQNRIPLDYLAKMIH